MREMRAEKHAVEEEKSMAIISGYEHDKASGLIIILIQKHMKVQGEAT